MHQGSAAQPAHQVEVVISRLLPVVPPASCSRKTLQSSSSSLSGWEASLEDLQQGEDQDSSLMEDSMEETADKVKKSSLIRGFTSFSCCFSLEEILSRSLWTEHVNQPSAAAVNIWTWCQQNQSHIFRRSKRATTHKQEEVGTENRRNTRTKLTPKKAESSSSGCRFDSQSSRKDGTLQKIGDFLQSSPTLLGSKAKKMMSLVSGRLDPDSAAASSSLSLRAKRGRKKLYRPEISCPMDMPPHPMINQETDGEGQSDHDIIKRRLRSRAAKS
ncbi:kinesin-like protein KIF20B isoform X2 [Fundulus heteroclitus]|uniref:kinesin-like protein KIF20B isoform X2 n=1 Tax=Fundulus heteroclitus TaxID=8078 RepID=UPI00165B40F0|nr:kinesin-like protein KIF20B isoform X2 [Fundulus heteroclitus]